MRLERFQTGRTLAREIFLDMPRNRKMLRVAHSGDELRSALLARLPVKGVRALYVRTLEPEGLASDPETYPIYAERSRETLAAPAESALAQAVAPTPEESAASRLAPDLPGAEEETVVPGGREDWLAASEHFAREAPPEELHRFGPENPAVESAIREAVPERAEFEFGTEDRFFPNAAVEELRALDRRAEREREEAERLFRDDEEESATRVAAGSAEPETAEARLRAEEQSYAYDVIDNTPAESVRELGARLVEVVRAFAVSGEQEGSPELKEIAGVLGESARVFFNSLVVPGLAPEAAARVLYDLREVKQDLRVLTMRGKIPAGSRLGVLVHEAVRVFRRGVRDT